MVDAARIVTLSLNPAIDQTAEIERFTAGRVNRVRRERSDAGGKGVNVASFLADAGLPATATGFLGEANQEVFRDLFARKGIEDRFLRLPGRTRVNVKVVDQALDQVTDINFPGLTPGPADLARLTNTIDALCAESDWFVLTGRVPDEVPAGIYADLIARLKARGKRVLLDTSAAPFAAAVRCRPDAVKPNVHELAELLGRTLSDQAEVLAAARTLTEGGIDLVVVSMGPDGALFVEGDAALLAVPPSVAVKSTVGAGDAMVAGILAGTRRGLDLEGRARLATAFSLGALGEPGPNLPAADAIKAFAARVTIRAPGGH